MGGQTRCLTPEQKERIAERRKVGEARIAEAQIMLDEKIKKSGGRPDFADQIAAARKDFQAERERIDRETEQAIEAIRNG
ncbi:MAG: hypothetical protein HQK87_02305 [Nitrospinae bacterium]|nr:hypothetical protein [Nitrospinota bacterium]